MMQIEEVEVMEWFGYARVSTKEQNEDRQMIALEAAGIKKQNIVIDKQSGKDFQRPGYQDMITRLQPNDVLFIKSIDRLGRDYAEIQNEWRFLVKEKKIDIVVLDMPILDTRTAKDLIGTFVSDVVLQVLSFVSENERRQIRQRQAEGISAARLRGVKFGRPRVELPENFETVSLLWQSGEISAAAAAEACGMSRSSFQRYAKAVII